jgi:hypothetical protein
MIPFQNRRFQAKNVLWFITPKFTLCLSPKPLRRTAPWFLDLSTRYQLNVSFTFRPSLTSMELYRSRIRSPDKNPQLTVINNKCIWIDFSTRLSIDLSSVTLHTNPHVQHRMKCRSYPFCPDPSPHFYPQQLTACWSNSTQPGCVFAQPSTSRPYGVAMPLLCYVLRRT